MEVQNIRDFLLALPSPPLITESIHSYSQLWLYPYGYAEDTFPPNVAEHRQLAQLAVDTLLTVHGTEFIAENEADLYIASGTAMDWFCRDLGATYCFTTELRDTGISLVSCLIRCSICDGYKTPPMTVVIPGNYGFLLPKDQIYASGEEFTEAMVTVIKSAMAKQTN